MQIFTSIIRTADSEDMADLLPKLPEDDARFLMFLVVQAGNPTLASIIDAMPTAIDSTGDPVLRYLLDPPMERFTALIRGLRATHFDTYAQAVLIKAAAPERGDHTIARDVAFLFGTGEASTGKLLLGTALHGRSNTDLTKMIATLRQQNQPDSLRSAAEWITETYARIGSSNVDGILRQVGLNEYTSRGNWLKRRRRND